MLISYVLLTYRYILKATFFSVSLAVMIWWLGRAYQKIEVLHGGALKANYRDFCSEDLSLNILLQYCLVVGKEGRASKSLISFVYSSLKLLFKKAVDRDFIFKNNTLDIHFSFFF